MYLPVSNWRKQITHWNPLLKFKLLRTKYTKRVIKIAYCYEFKSAVHFCEMERKNSVTVKLLFMFISLTTNHIIYIEPARYADRAHLNLRNFNNELMYTTIANIMIKTSCPVLFRCSNTVYVDTFTALYSHPLLSF